MIDKDKELSYAICENCGNEVGTPFVTELGKNKAPVVIKPSGWIVCKACGSRWRP